MTKSQHLWKRATVLLSNPNFFESERDRVLTAYPLLNSHGLGQGHRRRRHHVSGRWETERIPDDLEAARDELRTGGRYETGIRDTLMYFVEGRVSVSYRLRGCGWARRFNGPAPPKHSSYFIKHQAERYLTEMDRRRGTDGDRYVSNGAFICAALMAGLRMWSYQNSVNPDFRLGKPWAVAGLQPEDYGHPEDERMARFWRWAVQQDVGAPFVEDFVTDTADLLYSGADLKQLREGIAAGCSEAKKTYYLLRREFGFDEEQDRRFWSMKMEEGDVGE